jgi:hypothetical protein
LLFWDSVSLLFIQNNYSFQLLSILTYFINFLLLQCLFLFYCVQSLIFQQGLASHTFGLSKMNKNLYDHKFLARICYSIPLSPCNHW